MSTSLVEFVHEQRWFGAKSQEVSEANVVDEAVVRDDPPLSIALVELRYGDGNHDLYQLLLGQDKVDVIGDPETGPELVRLVRNGEAISTRDGQIAFTRFGHPPQTTLEESRQLGVEQSNSALVVDDTHFVKVYRRIEAGENPDLELTRFLSEHGYQNVPALWGWWSYEGAPLSATLGMVQEFVPGSIDGWTLALDELRASPDVFVSRIERLGEVIGRLHRTLASDRDDAGFCPEEASVESLALQIATMDDDIEQVFMHLPDTEAVAPIAGRGDAVRDLLREVAVAGSVGLRIRTHGDLHLGQVLFARDDWLVIDFEGEPARPLPERRLKQSPLRDVAGMLRSFTYAVSVTGTPVEIEQRTRAAFLAGYMNVMGGSGILPGDDAVHRLLRVYELEKAVYELRYELNNRPDWVPVPVAGIVRLLDEAAG